MLINTAILILLITCGALFLQDKFKIPLPMTLVALVMGAKLIGIEHLHVSNERFDQIIILLLPILITVDALHLRTSELKRHAFSLFYLAVLAVIFCVLACVALNNWILPDYNLSIAALIALFCMVMATDPIAVTAVFNNFKVPHNLKIMAEGESLFNDATTLIMFGLAMSVLQSQAEVEVTNVATKSAMVVFGAIGVGMVIGFIGMWFMGHTHNPAIETMLILAIACGSFVAAEHFHWSGILATLAGVLTANHVISNRLDHDDKVIDEMDHLEAKSSSSWLPDWVNIHRRYEDAVTDKANHKMILQNIGFIALIGGTILFLSMTDTFSVDLMVRYWKEIIAVFIATTVVRMLVMSKFALIASRVKFCHDVSFHWWAVLSAAGVKGGISILMLHMLPKGFEHRELFEAIVIGQVLLSTFIYPVVLMIIMTIYKKTFEAEVAAEAHAH